MCEKCGDEVYQRAGEDEETGAKRLDVNSEPARPVLDCYEGLGYLQSINGEVDINKVFADIAVLIGGWA
ncbi:UNVERIFIED_CONTAM: hypothetical protein ACS92_02705 [Bacillus cereus]